MRKKVEAGLKNPNPHESSKFFSLKEKQLRSYDEIIKDKRRELTGCGFSDFASLELLAESIFTAEPPPTHAPPPVRASKASKQEFTFRTPLEQRLVDVLSKY